MATMASDWQRHFGLLYNPWAEFNETCHEASPLLDWIIQSLLLADRDWIVLPRLSIYRSQFGRAEIKVDFMNFFAIFQLKQLYFKHTLYFLQVKSILKIIIFHTVYCAQTDKVESIIWNMKVMPSVWAKKTMKMINFVLDLTWSKEVGRK